MRDRHTPEFLCEEYPGRDKPGSRDMIASRGSWGPDEARKGRRDGEAPRPDGGRMGGRCRPAEHLGY